MKITADTNLLVRVLTEDDPRQTKLAENALTKAETVALTVPTLCELVWVLSQGYRIPRGEIAEAIRRLINGANVVANRPAVEAGVAMLDAGGDFADAAIAYEGTWLGAEEFLSFDGNAVKLLRAQGAAARLLS